jgi:hypothetical protein
VVPPALGEEPRQHEASLGEVGEGSSEHEARLDWFRTIQLWLELDGLRVVRACWHRSSMDLLARTSGRPTR